MFQKHTVRSVLLGIGIVGLLLSVNVSEVGAASTVTPNSTTNPACAPLTTFNQVNFSNPLNINNPLSPLVPGTQFTLSGTTSTGVHSIVLTVTDLSKVVDGVTTRVLWDKDYQNNVLTESELAFQAQDNQGNLWVLGEYPELFDAGKFTGAPDTWISGIDQAKGGVLVPGTIKVGSASFLEGKSLSIDFWDCAKVYAKGQSVSGPTGNYSNVVVINEWGYLDPAGGIQQKYYAPGVGNVQIGALNDPEAETLALVSVKHLSASAMTTIRDEVKAMDKHGDQVSAVYSQTQKVKLNP